MFPIKRNSELVDKFWTTKRIIIFVAASLLAISISASVTFYFMKHTTNCRIATPLVNQGTSTPTSINSQDDGVTLYDEPGANSGYCVTFPPGQNGTETTYELSQYGLEEKVSSVRIPPHPSCQSIGKFHLRLYRKDKAQAEFDRTTVQIQAEYDNAGDTITVKANDCPAASTPTPSSSSNNASISNHLPIIQECIAARGGSKNATNICNMRR